MTKTIVVEILRSMPVWVGVTFAAIILLLVNLPNILVSIARTTNLNLSLKERSLKKLRELLPLEQNPSYVSKFEEYLASRQFYSIIARNAKREFNCINCRGPWVNNLGLFVLLLLILVLWNYLTYLQAESSLYSFKESQFLVCIVILVFAVVDLPYCCVLLMLLFLAISNSIAIDDWTEKKRARKLLSTYEQENTIHFSKLMTTIRRRGRDFAIVNLSNLYNAGNELNWIDITPSQWRTFVNHNLKVLENIDLYFFSDYGIESKMISLLFKELGLSAYDLGSVPKEGRLKRKFWRKLFICRYYFDKFKEEDCQTIFSYVNLSREIELVSCEDSSDVELIKDNSKKAIYIQFGNQIVKEYKMKDLRKIDKKIKFSRFENVCGHSGIIDGMLMIFDGNRHFFPTKILWQKGRFVASEIIKRIKD